jgi:peptide/nickel transport system ATP-binding protein
MTETALTVMNLEIALKSGPPIVQDVSFTVGRGETLAVVGESGSGKTTLGLALLGYARSGVRIAGGSVVVAGTEMVGPREEELRRLRGRVVAYVPQDPASSLIPTLRVGAQVDEIQRMHGRRVDHQVTADVLAAVQLPSTRTFLRRYPHQLSGGQQQRLSLALAIVSEPAVLVLDEPTTGLDVVTQARILGSIKEIQKRTNAAIVYVSHDLAVVASIADAIAVMYAGRIVEYSESPTELFDLPRHPYTAGLIASVPDHIAPRVLHGMPGVAVGLGDRPTGCAFAPRCRQRVDECEQAMPQLTRIDSGHDVRCLRWELTPRAPRVARISVAEDDRAAQLLQVIDLRAVHADRMGEVVAAESVSFSVRRGECLALVGESGSGKTTVARCIAGLHAPSAGSILLDGTPLAPTARQRPKLARQRLQIVFQNPYDTLNPRLTVRASLLRAMRFFGHAESSRADMSELFSRVRLPDSLADRYPSELSGGERQRVAIARALAARPEVVICDEVTSALDVSVQAAVLELLTSLRTEIGVSLLLITHDLGVVASIADRVIVLEKGEICEEGTVADVLAHPKDAYTRRLVSAAPTIDQTSSHDSAGGSRG